MAGVHNYVWDQGADLELNFTYKEGTTEIGVQPVDLTGYSLRMDIRKNNVDGVRVWTFNSADIPTEPESDTTGPADNEAVLGSDGKISITVPRSLTLANGAVFAEMNAGVTTFAYDIFLRNPANKQKKIMTGLITVNKSVTLWS